MKQLLPADPGPPHPLDLCRVLVLGVPPWPGLGITAVIVVDTDGMPWIGETP